MSDVWAKMSDEDKMDCISGEEVGLNFALETLKIFLISLINKKASNIFFFFMIWWDLVGVFFQTYWFDFYSET